MNLDGADVKSLEGEGDGCEWRCDAPHVRPRFIARSIENGCDVAKHAQRGPDHAAALRGTWRFASHNGIEGGLTIFFIPPSTLGDVLW